MVVSDTEVMHEIFENTVTYIEPFNVPNNIVTIEGSSNQSGYILNKHSWYQSVVLINFFVKIPIGWDELSLELYDKS